MNRRVYQHQITIAVAEAGKVLTRQQGWNYFKEMLQVANVDSANRKSTNETRTSLVGLLTTITPVHVTYFRDDTNCLEWTRWLIRNGFAFSYAYNGDGFETEN